MVGSLYQVWRDTEYVYSATSSGLSVFDIYSANKVASIYNDGGFTTVWGTDTIIYLGTFNDGVKYIDKVGIVEEGTTTNLKNFTYQDPTSFCVRYIHGYGDILAIVTTSGLDVVKNGPHGFKSSVCGNTFTKCFMTSKNELYYVGQGPTVSGLYKINSILWDWTSQNTFYESGASFLPGSQVINDIFVTENTSLNGIDNTLFVATTSGVYVLDEGIGEFDTYYNKGV